MYVPVRRVAQSVIRGLSIKHVGILYLAGDVILVLLGGGVDSKWCESVAGAGFIGNALIMSGKGDDPRWFAFTCLTGVPLNVLTVYDELVAGSAADWIGLSLIVVSSLFGGFSVPLSSRFRYAHNGAIRHVLGHPRKTMGILLIFGKLPLLLDSIQRVNCILFVSLVLWITGDVLLGLLPIRSLARSGQVCSV